MDEKLVRGVVDEAHDGDVVALLEAGVHQENVKTADHDHALVLVGEADPIRLLSYPRHPETGTRLDVSFVPTLLAQDVVDRGHEDDPVRYRFLDNLRSAEVLEDTDGLAADLASRARDQVTTDRLLGDYVHTACAFVEDMWGLWERGDVRGTWMVAREVAQGAVGLLWDEEHGELPGPAEFPGLVEELPDDHGRTWDRLHPAPEDGADRLADLLEVPARLDPVDFRPDPQRGPLEERLLEDVEGIAEDLVDEHGDDVRAVGATGSIGRESATEGADYDVHVLVEPRHPDDRHRIDFRLHVPTYPGLDRRAEIGFTPTSFLDQALEDGVTETYAYEHLDHVRHTALVHDPDGEGAAYKERAWEARPPEGYVGKRVDLLREAVDRSADLGGRARASVWDLLANQGARLLLMRYGLGYVKPKYRSLNLDRIRDRHPAFFEDYDALMGLGGVDREETLEAARAATRLFDHALERTGVDLRYRPEEADTETGG